MKSLLILLSLTSMLMSQCLEITISLAYDHSYDEIKDIDMHPRIVIAYHQQSGKYKELWSRTYGDIMMKRYSDSTFEDSVFKYESFSVRCNNRTPKDPDCFGKREGFVKTYEMEGKVRKTFNIINFTDFDAGAIKDTIGNLISLKENPRAYGRGTFQEVLSRRDEQYRDQYPNFVVYKFNSIRGYYRIDTKKVEKVYVTRNSLKEEVVDFCKDSIKIDTIEVDTSIVIDTIPVRVEYSPNTLPSLYDNKYNVLGVKRRSGILLGRTFKR